MADAPDPRTPDDFPVEVHASLWALQQLSAERGIRRDDPRWRKATPDEVALSELQRQPYHCTGHAIRTGLACRLNAVTGGAVCLHHGAQYKHVKAARERRLTEMSGHVIGEMYRMARAKKHTLVKVKAAMDLLDRAGVGALVEAKVRASYRGQLDAGVTVQIGFLQTLTPELAAAEKYDQPLLPAADVIDVEATEAQGDRRQGDGDPSAADAGGD